MSVAICISIERISMETIEKYLLEEEDIIIDYDNTAHSRITICDEINEALQGEYVRIFVNMNDTQINLEDYECLWLWKNIRHVIIRVMDNLNVYHTQNPFEP